jgi:signal transduction histidine kinase
MPRSALLIEDNSSHAVLIEEELAGALPGWILDTAGTMASARKLMARQRYDLVVVDYWLPDVEGLTALREIRATAPRVPTIFVTTIASARVAVEAMRLGADDYLVKEEGYLDVLPYLVHEVLERYRLAEERVALEERVRRAERSATLGYLASGLAHHINNPLATIQTFLQLFPTHLDDDEFVGRYRAMALSETDRIRSLVLDIMRAATVPVPGNDVNDLREILLQAEASVAEELRAKRLTCRLSVPSQIPAVRVHREAAACLFQTLLQNAARFSPDGAEIEMRTSVAEDGKRVVTIVHDHGPGVPAEDRQRIFEPFFTTTTSGFGMGLFVASRIADLQDIELHLLDEPVGAAFHVGIPVG